MSEKSETTDIVQSRKISVSLPSNIVDDLDLLAHLAGVSRSGFLSAVLVKSLPAVKDATISLCEAISEDVSKGGFDGSSADVVKRYRSASKGIVDSFIASLDDEVQHDMFGKK